MFNPEYDVDIDEEDNDASKCTNNVVPKVTTEEARCNTESDQNEGDQSGAVREVLHEAGDLKGGAASGVSSSHDVVAGIIAVDLNIEIIESKSLRSGITLDIEGSIVLLALGYVHYWLDAVVSGLP